MRQDALPFGLLLLLSSTTSLSSAWLSPSSSGCIRNSRTQSSHPFTASAIQMNFLNDIGDMLSGGKLVVQTVSELPHKALGDRCSSTTTLAIQERAISFTGEDFDVQNIDTNQEFAKVRGAMLHLPGKVRSR